MQIDSGSAGPASALAARLRLKRTFLLAMIASLATCAFVAILVLLLGSFSSTTYKILGSLAALAVHCGIAMACASTLERRVRPAFSQVGLALFACNFAVLVATIWWPTARPWGEPYALYGVLTTLTVCGSYVVAIPCANLLEKRRWRPLPEIGLTACTLALLMTLVCIWAEHRYENVWFGRMTAVVSVAAFSLAHTCLLGRIPVGKPYQWLLTGTVICVWVVGGIVALMIVGDISDETIVRVLAVAAVLDASGSLTLLILSRLSWIGKIEQLESAAARIEIRCPRCSRQQTVDAGDSTCADCGLKFRIEIEEPRCAKCNYLLYQLPQRRCPECGTPF